jgi:hypothetical protein
MISTRNFLIKDINILIFFGKLLIYVNSASTADDCALLPCRVGVGLARFKGKFRFVFILLRGLFK